MNQAYTRIQQFDFQILRFTGQLSQKYLEVRQDLLEIGEKVKDFETWYQWWHTKANFYEHKKLFEIAMAYHRASLFYLSFTDERKLVAYQAFRRCFERHYQNDGFEYFNVPYEYGKLPAICIPKKESKKTLLIMSGFDSFAEELVSWFYPIKDQLDANIILFDGPGQGSTPFQKLHFTPDYENVVSTVLDYFEVDEADGIGVSWGGYFILRAAAFEKRLKRCICFDIFYSGLDALKLQITKLPPQNMIF